MATNVEKSRHKLRARWIGPMRVQSLIREQVAQVRELTGDKKLRQVHTSRLKFYHDKDLNVTSELLNHLEYENRTLDIVDEFVGLRKRSGILEVKTKWIGFEETEITWEPVMTMSEDLPEKCAAYLNTAQLPTALRKESLQLLNRSRRPVQGAL